jgi:hypothetical protein
VKATEHVYGWGALGIDLAAQPERTAACLIDWQADGRGRVVALADGRLSDGRLLALMRIPGVRKVGIDAPLGWPCEFVEALVAYSSDGTWPVLLCDGEGQRHLVLRETDRFVWDVVRQRPLSVSTDRIAYPAMRAARLLANLGEPLDRVGGGRVAEVYPAAALRQWGLSPSASADDPGSYKGRSPEAARRRRRLVALLVEQTRGWLELGESQLAACRASDDQLDALVSALVATAVVRGCVLPPPADRARAEREGWIWLPKCEPLRALAPTS